MKKGVLRCGVYGLCTDVMEEILTFLTEDDWGDWRCVSVYFKDKIISVLFSVSGRLLWGTRLDNGRFENACRVFQKQKLREDVFILVIQNATTGKMTLSRCTESNNMGWTSIAMQAMIHPLASQLGKRFPTIYSYLFSIANSKYNSVQRQQRNADSSHPPPSAL